MQKITTTGSKRIIFIFLYFLTGLAHAESQSLAPPPALALDVNTLKVSLSWTEQTNATGYSLYYAPIPYNGPETIGKINMALKTDFTATLWPGAAYYVAIKSYNEVHKSDFSNIEAITIPAQLNSRVTWQSIAFASKVNLDVQNVTDILSTSDGRILASFYDEDRMNYIALSSDQGQNWQVTSFPEGVQNIRALRQLHDGSFIMGCSAKNSEALLFNSQDGLEWSAIETTNESLPNQYSTSVWDILQLSNGDILLATDNTNNDPDKNNPTLYRLTDNKLEVIASFPGLGVLSLERDNEGILYLATEQSDVHDDPELAGQARIYKSSNAGSNWEEVATPEGANRIYDMLLASDNTLYLATGISGDFYRSSDKGASWQVMMHVPTSERLWGDPPVMTAADATRVYQIMELENGIIMVGTGNTTGGIFLTEDKGQTWLTTSSTGTNIVTWGLAQSPENGLLWAGTGSYGGDIFTARYQSGKNE